MRITWDPAKAVENLRSHRVRFEEAGEVLRDPFALTQGSCPFTMRIIVVDPSRAV